MSDFCFSLPRQQHKTKQKLFLVVALIGAVSADVSHLFDNSNGYNYQKPQDQFDPSRPTQNYLPPLGQNGQSQNGQLQNGQPQNGQFQSGNSPNGQFQSGNSPNSQFPSGNSPSGQFQSGNSPNGQFQNGNSPNGQSPNGPLSNVNQRYLPPGQFGRFLFLLTVGRSSMIDSVNLTRSPILLPLL